MSGCNSRDGDVGQGLNYDDDGNLIEAYVASDLNNDGQVDIVDLTLMLNAYGAGSTCANPAPIDTKYFYRADVNDDCVINLADLVALLGNFGLSSAHSMHAMFYWDAENRLIEVLPSSATTSSKRVKFSYDYMSRRVDKRVYSFSGGQWQTVPSKHTRWVYFGWLPILELKVTHAASGEETGTVIARKYTWGLDLSQSVGGAGGIGGLLASVDCGENTTVSDDRTFAYFYDGNGSVTQLIETTGSTAGTSFGTLAARYEYDPYGRPLLDVADAGISGTYAATNTFRFSTKPIDAETSFSYFGYRYYSATMGRWISRDPTGESDGVLLFAFVGNQPVSAIDALGLEEYAVIHRTLPNSAPEIVKTELKADSYGHRWFSTEGPITGVPKTHTVEMNYKLQLNNVREIPECVIRRMQIETQLTLDALGTNNSKTFADLFYKRLAAWISQQPESAFLIPKRSRKGFNWHLCVKESAWKGAEARIMSIAGEGSAAAVEALAQLSKAEAALAAEAEASLLAAARKTYGDKVIRVLKIGGKTLVILGGAYSFYSIITAENWGRQAAIEVGGWGGALALGAGGAEVGAYTAPWLGPWAAIPVAVLGLGGGALGYFVGSNTAEAVYDWIFAPGTPAYEQ